MCHCTGFPSSHFGSSVPVWQSDEVFGVHLIVLMIWWWLRLTSVNLFFNIA